MGLYQRVLAEDQSKFCHSLDEQKERMRNNVTIIIMKYIFGMRGEITYVAMRDIRASEEITQGYCLLDNSDYKLECTCGASNCRKIITDQD